VTVNWPSDVVSNNATLNVTTPVNDVSSPNGSTVRQTSLQRRWAVDFTFPPLPVDKANRAHAALVQASGDTLLINIPPAVIGAPAVGSTSTVAVEWVAGSGLVLQVAGLTNAVPIQAGNFASILTGGRWYLYQIGAANTQSGTRSLTMAGLARVTHGAGDPVRIAAPVIEGLVIGEASRTVGVDFLAGVTLTVREP